MPRGPNLFFRQRDLVRALRSAQLAGIPSARVTIDKASGNLTIDARLGEAPLRARKPRLRGAATSKTSP